MKVEYNGIDLSKATTSASEPYTHTFAHPRLRWNIRLRRWIQRPLSLHRAGYGWVFTKRQAYKVLTRMLNAKLKGK